MSVQVKGTILIDLVKQVRAEKDRNWEQYLTAEDMALINGEVLTSSWYPDDFFYRLSLAVYKEIGQSSLEACFAYGQLTAHNMAEIYKNLVAPGDPATTIERFVKRRQSFFSTDYQDAEKNQVERRTDGITLHSVADPSIRGTEIEEVINHSLLGILHEMAVIAGTQPVRSKVTKNDDSHDLTVTWG
ncbi:MAG: hypothetical protein ACLFPD_05630 [Desulfosudaceae bacterium]